ncbi:unnamed protein product [Acanthocheilonema viteae]|uniref:Uncharacterized protein n=1 Tax=Acanthocheilonema viteae TaxID=6277 RepID=A0A498SH98_ACAVI|nr:unnamed protein product [Acanthocheilonema viteae]
MKRYYEYSPFCLLFSNTLCIKKCNDGDGVGEGVGGEEEEDVLCWEKEVCRRVMLMAHRKSFITIVSYQMKLCSNSSPHDQIDAEDGSTLA